ncbi:hypothetical protein MASR2M15_25750 [Anaerolineales bacterium]
MASGFLVVAILLSLLTLMDRSAYCSLAQDSPCLAQNATISALELENLQLKLTLTSVAIHPTESPTPPVLSPTTASVTSTRAVKSGPVQIMALADYDEVNIRAEPALDAEIVGVLKQGEKTLATGRYFRWIEIIFPLGSKEKAWVFESVIETDGDLKTLPEVVPEGFDEIAVSQFAIIGANGIGDIDQEEIILRNRGETVNLEGWVLENESGQKLILPSLLFFKGSALSIFSGVGKNTDDKIFWNQKEAQWQHGEILLFKDADLLVQLKAIIP